MSVPHSEWRTGSGNVPGSVVGLFSIPGLIPWIPVRSPAAARGTQRSHCRKTPAPDKDMKN
jgi:hypothetical protein